MSPLLLPMPLYEGGASPAPPQQVGQRYNFPFLLPMPLREGGTFLVPPQWVGQSCFACFLPK